VAVVPPSKRRRSREGSDVSDAQRGARPEGDPPPSPKTFTQRDVNEAYWMGVFNNCKALGEDPRFNRRQIAIIRTQGYKAIEQLEKCGVKFNLTAEYLAWKAGRNGRAE
jgi:hypothetical protein